AFVVRTALTPLYERAAAPHRHAVADGAWGRGVCPVCGSEPALGRLALPDGRRMLFCALCRIEWPFERLRCPFCRDPDGTGPQLRFFTAGGDQARRVECCDRCMRYLKTVDERVDGRRANLPLEEVVTAHLDAAATARGYR
ncbi:MAG: formate dehydrogenase accessory protein FdhE, partial [Planctomycetota bacterium]